MAAAGGQARQVLRRAARLQIAVLIGKPHHRIRVPDVDPLRIGSRRIERNAVRPVQAAGENFHLLGLGLAADAAEHSDIPGIALGHEIIAIGGHANQARRVQPGRVEIHLESSGSFRPRVWRTVNEFGRIPRGFRGKRRGQILNGDLANGSRRFMAEIRKWSLGRRCAGNASVQFGRVDAPGNGRQARLHVGDNLPAPLVRQ